MDFDVIIAGGGPAGFAAAVAMSESELDVLLVERMNSLGGMGTHGLVPMIRTAGDRSSFIQDYWSRLGEINGCVMTDRHAFVNPCLGGMIALEMCLEAGVHVRLNTMVNGVESVGGRISGVWLADKGGRSLVSAKIYVDATGDGDLAAWAGAPFDKGREKDGRLQAVSMNFHVAGVKVDELPDADSFKDLCAKAISRGELDMPEYTLKHLTYGDPAEWLPESIFRYQFDFDFNVDASDPESYSKGEVVCQSRVLQFWRFLKSDVPGFESATLVNIASSLGVRETRRVRGESTLTAEDVLRGRKRPDGICRCSWYMDLHDGQNKEPMQQYSSERSPAHGDFFEIPYGCLVPKNVENLLVCGRCVSSTRPANGALRLQVTCMNLGQAAGTAAILCVKKNRSPREIDARELRSILVDSGMEL